MFVYWSDVRAESYKLPSHRQCVDVSHTMRHLNKIVILIATFSLFSCGGATYKLISNGTGYTNDTRFNIKHVLDGCCGCSGVLVNTFHGAQLQSQLFVESNEGCPFNWTKYNFHYSQNGSLTQVDTLIAVADSSFKYPITEIDRIALTKVDSFIATQNSSLYRLRKIDIRGYRDKTQTDKDKLMLLPPRLDKHALY